MVKGTSLLLGDFYGYMSTETDAAEDYAPQIAYGSVGNNLVVIWSHGNPPPFIHTTGTTTAYQIASTTALSVSTSQATTNADITTGSDATTGVNKKRTHKMDAISKRSIEISSFVFTEKLDASNRRYQEQTGFALKSSHKAAGVGSIVTRSICVQEFNGGDSSSTKKILIGVLIPRYQLTYSFNNT